MIYSVKQNARRRAESAAKKAASAEAPSKVASPSGAFSVTGGSLPVSNAEFLQAASILDRFAAQLERGKFIHLPPQYREMACTLRAQACRATERQPEENV